MYELSRATGPYLFMPTVQRKMTGTFSSQIDWGASQLSEAGVENPRSEAELLFAEALSINRQELWLENERLLGQQETARWQNFVKRRSAREPFAYIIGRKEFWSLDFKVNRDVLTPRPETEQLIDCLLNLVKINPRQDEVMVLDIGTGSGNIAVVAAREISQSKVVAVDISAEALAVASENIRLHGLSDKIQLVQSDLFEELKIKETAQFDYILSNPPYIESREIDKLMSEVRDYEPRTALDGGDSGLEFYERIISGSCSTLRPGGFMILEIGPEQAGKITELLEKQGGFKTPNVASDYSGRDRILSVQRKANG